ncbi:flippase-like domain-containing protein, partial [bacterium]|nr:flippase-like domain-containing protein [bacterium]
IYHSFYKYKSRKKIILSTILLSMILQSIYIIMVYLMGKAIGMNVYLYHYFLFIPIISTVAAIPISISGLGVNENLFVYCFGLVGAQEESALVIAFLARIVLLVWSLPGWYYYMTIGEAKIDEDTMKIEVRTLEDQI